MLFIGALRVKNEERWIGEVLDSMNFCHEIFLFDDHSSDQTREIAKGKGALVIDSPFESFDEARDKDHLVSCIAEKYPVGTWIIMIDGDEILAPDAKEVLLRDMEFNPFAVAWKLRILYLWNSRDQIRIDGVYGHFERPSVFRLQVNNGFKRTSPAGNLHCSSVPASLAFRSRSSHASILHLGYMERIDRLRKWEYYNSLDPCNECEGFDFNHVERGSYPWIVQGDIPEVPSDIKLKCAGPLELKKL